MRISLDYTKSLEANAEHYFEQAKLYKKKLEGARIALLYTKKKLENLEKEKTQKEEQETQKEEKKPRKTEWYEKFRWFYTSENFLVIAGRDAQTNEIVVKKHTDKHDLIFHTEMAGSPFAILKTEGKKPSDISIEETAQFVACYSKAWKLGRTIMEVFYVNPDQVTKEAPSGEYITRGAFMIYGKKTILTAELKLFIGKMDDKLMAGPESAVKKHCKKYIRLIQGNAKPSDVAKTIKHKLDSDNLDEIFRLLPPESKIKE